MAGSVCQIIGYVLQAPAPPFPVMCIALVVNGIGIAIQNAQGNALVASLHNNTHTKMGILHAAYGMLLPTVNTVE